MEIRKLTVGSVETNCYILINEKDIVIIDPGASARRIADTVAEYPDCSVKGIILTHGHFDHIGAVDALHRKYHCPVYGCREDEKIMTDVRYNSYFGESAVITVPITWIENSHLKIGSFDFEVLFTPGHTAGSIMLRYENCLFSGDTLFRESVGRTDLYSGSFSQLLQSLQCLNELPYDMTVYPGHGEETTIAYEIQHNPFIK
jgi:glyoxylase-like metal-dependent hydrolase (beta-lactamase superfamily II)